MATKCKKTRKNSYAYHIDKTFDSNKADQISDLCKELFGNDGVTAAIHLAAMLYVVCPSRREIHDVVDAVGLARLKEDGE